MFYKAYFHISFDFSDVQFSAICVGNFVCSGLDHFIDWTLGQSSKGFELVVPAIENDVEIMFP